MNRAEELRRLLAEALEEMPAPWEPFFTTHGDPYVLARCRRDASRPGSFPADVVAEVATGPTDYGRAVATLIAAAPEALRDLLDVHEEARSAHEGSCLNCHVMHPDVCGLAAALARWEGS